MRNFATAPKPITHVSPLTAISPIDGRYASACHPLRAYYSEFALIRFRVYVELQWFKRLFDEEIVSSDTKTNQVVQGEHAWLDRVFDEFNLEDAERVKEIEKVTNHDVKAVEYFLKERFDGNPRISNLKEYLHFSCTSEDINNLAYAVMLQHSFEQVVLPQLRELQTTLTQMADQNADVPMMSRTHGQTATPTTLGKEIANFAHRLNRQIKTLEKIKPLGKFNGAVGNLNAHQVAYPDKDWLGISQRFVEGMNIAWNPYTTQIEPHDSIAEISLNLSLIDTILIDFSRDMWMYISLGYFTQKNVKGEVGSSTMPHKINPINFENAEGNLGMAIALFTHFAQKLPISRYQRDLSDSTVLRNLGVAISYSLQAVTALQKGLGRIDVNKPVLESELNQNY